MMWGQDKGRNFIDELFSLYLNLLYWKYIHVIVSCGQVCLEAVDIKNKNSDLFWLLTTPV